MTVNDRPMKMLLNVFLNWIAGWYQLRFGSNSFKESCQAGTGNQSTFAGLTGCLKQDKTKNYHIVAYLVSK